jgi:hypothetical protein
MTTTRDHDRGCECRACQVGMAQVIAELEVKIAAMGYAVVGVMEERPWGYTVGRWPEHPELVCHGTSNEHVAPALNMVVEIIGDDKIEDLAIYRDDDGRPMFQLFRVQPNININVAVQRAQANGWLPPVLYQVAFADDEGRLPADEGWAYNGVSGIGRHPDGRIHLHEYGRLV